MGLNQLKSNPNVALTVGALNANNSTGSTGQYLESTGTGTRWTSLNVNVSSLSSPTISSPTITGTITLSNGVGTNGQALVSTGSGVQWGSAGATLSDNTSTNATYYPTLSSATSGSYTTAIVSSTKLTFNPSTGNFSATQFTSLSDQTLKTNIRPIEDSLALVQRLQGVRFDWLETNKPSLGLIAQEVEKVIPELVETDNGIKSVSYSNMIGLLIEAIKEQQNQIEELKLEINILKNK
jgi:hypothetical protein